DRRGRTHRTRDRRYRPALIGRAGTGCHRRRQAHLRHRLERRCPGGRTDEHGDQALDPGTDDSTGPAAPDAPAFVLPTTTAAALGRLQEPAPVFSASPTPTPEMGSDTFDDAIGARMSWLADQKIGHAHIKVTPNEMGPVEVRLHLEGDKVNASFSSANADVRQALEQSLPRLREMLGQNGFQLGQADVGQQQQNQSGNRNGGGSDGNGLSLDDSPPVGIPSVVLRQRGLLDAYA
ncbi:hypothetical protein XPN_2016, partial [Xanthomonas arboricola pv. pruni MAFF 301427]